MLSTFLRLMPQHTIKQLTLARSSCTTITNHYVTCLAIAVTLSAASGQEGRQACASTGIVAILRSRPCGSRPTKACNSADSYQQKDYWRSIF